MDINQEEDMRWRNQQRDRGQLEKTLGRDIQFSDTYKSKEDITFITVHIATTTAKC